MMSEETGMPRTYTVQIVIDEDGRPKWLHDIEHEAKLPPEQLWVAVALHDAYESVKRAWGMQQQAKTMTKTKRTARLKQEQWERDAVQTELLLRRRHEAWEQAAAETELMLRSNAG